MISPALWSARQWAKGRPNVSAINDGVKPPP
jgi:hypothetical protein